MAMVLEYFHRACSPLTGRMFIVLVHPAPTFHWHKKLVVFYSSPGIHYHGNKRHKKLFI